MTKGKILRKLGAKELTAVFDAGEIVPYEYNIYSAQVIGYLQYDGIRLTASIFAIRSEDAQHGAMACWRFYKKSKELAQVVNAQQLELLGMAVWNEDLKAFLAQKGFQTKEVAIPDKLGNDGTETCYSKIIKVES
ncbi:MAG: hypothetical protein DRR08_06575 [Candidatus Parabeggiatoa sp. nov. 2]|nr:MAG: hypothetical protein B6247_01005 [Beggiatoa sp. 4572_84]RKZ62246.1 MAG: hypothetical protein DRR08_06575 [Gammaproteobacteria bacterium]